MSDIDRAINATMAPPPPPETAPGDVSVETMFGLGLVATDVVANVFTEAQMTLRSKIWPPGGRQPSRQEIEQFLDAIRLRIYEKARQDRFLVSRSGVVPSAPQGGAKPESVSEVPVDSQSDYLAYAERSRRNRE